MLTLRGWIILIIMLCELSLSGKASVHAQPLGVPDRSSPGDAMIQAYLTQETTRISAGFQDDVKSLDDWKMSRPKYVEEYRYMLGLPADSDRTPLKAKITGTLKGDGYAVDMLHYQSRPGLYVTGNLYRPAVSTPGDRLPTVFYVCGHSGRGRDGNKVAYQSHGIWFARHGYICLVVDTLQLGEIAASHHGTYHLQRWSWHSRGYTSAGIEAWNGVRGIDYLISRADVDPNRIAVTGISGGGAATFWVAAADERVRVAVPVSGMADLEAYIPNRVINGHCDCMFAYNTFRWPWTRIAGLVAPRPMLFINSDQDHIFPMDANERISNRLERLYSLYGAGDQVEAVVSVGGHAYRKDIRQAAFRFINSHLKDDSSPITDSEIDIVSEGNPPGIYPIPPESLRVFPTDASLPLDQLNTTIDEHFIPLANVSAPSVAEHADWKKSLIAELRRVSFGYFPAVIPAAQKLKDASPGIEHLQSEDHVEFHVRFPADAVTDSKAAPSNLLLVVLGEDEAGTVPNWLHDLPTQGQAIVFCEPRGIGATRWTRKNPPNYVERAHVLLGRTVDTGRVWDIIAAAKYLSSKYTSSESKPVIHLAGKGSAGVLAAYAAVLDDQFASLTVVAPDTTHLSNTAPQFLNVLRVCDVPISLGLLAPRPLTIIGSKSDAFQKTIDIYSVVGANDKLKCMK